MGTADVSTVEEQIDMLTERWDQLGLSEFRITAEDQTTSSWNWTLGEFGTQIKEQIQEAGLWRSLDTYKRSAWKM